MMSPTISIVATQATMMLATPDGGETKGPEFGKASPLGLLVILVLLAGTALLIRSMNSQLRKLPETFDAEHPEPDQAFDEGTDKVSVPDDDEVEVGPPGASPSASSPEK